MASHLKSKDKRGADEPRARVITAHSRPERKKKAPLSRGRRITSVVLLVVAVVLAGVACYLYMDTQHQYDVQEQVNEKLAAYARVEDGGSRPPEVDWAGLKAVNGDVVAWLQIPGTVINYPVFQGDDNDEYLRTSAEGTYSVGGQVFMDSENNSANLTDEQTILYGHHLKDGSMFKQVADMDDQTFFDSIRTVWYLTPDNTYELEPLFAYHVKEDDTTVRQFNWGSPAEFRSYLQSKLSGASAKRADASTIVEGCDHVLTLATCNYIEGKGRTVVVCVPKTEVKATTDTP